MAFPLLISALMSRRGQSQNMQGLGGISLEDLQGSMSAPMQFRGITDPNSLGSALALRRPRDFSSLIYQAGITPSLGMTGLKTGVGVGASYLKNKFGAGKIGKSKGGSYLSSRGRGDYA